LATWWARLHWSWSLTSWRPVDAVMAMELAPLRTTCGRRPPASASRPGLKEAPRNRQRG
jgi:hypothetical protein